MGLFSRRKKKEDTKEPSSESQQASFVYGVQDIFHLKNSDNLVVVGEVKGTVHTGDAVYVSNPGSDQDGILLTTVLGIELNPGEKAEQATDCKVGLCIEKGAKFPIHKATVLFTRDISTKSVHDTYIKVLGDVYVLRQNLELTDTDIEQLSITDCAETMSLFSWYHAKVLKDEAQDIKDANESKLEHMAQMLCEKIKKTDVIYCVYNKATGEPHMYSRTVAQQEGYLCTPPAIRIFTKAYADVMKRAYPEDQYEIRPIENGEKGDGIYNFFGSVFYLNGACGVQVILENISIAAQMLVPEPDYTNVPKQNIPVTNPALVRWMLLIGQMSKPEGKDQELIYKLYYRFMSLEMVKANLLIPMQKDGNLPEPDENEETTLKKDLTIQIPTIAGKYGRPAVRMFTDWKRLYMEYDEKWSAMVQPISAMISSFDCAVNATKYPKAGSYIGKEMYEDMKKFEVKKEQ